MLPPSPPPTPGLCPDPHRPLPQPHSPSSVASPSASGKGSIAPIPHGGARRAAVIPLRRGDAAAAGAGAEPAEVGGARPCGAWPAGGGEPGGGAPAKDLSGGRGGAHRWRAEARRGRSARREAIRIHTPSRLMPEPAAVFQDPSRSESPPAPLVGDCRASLIID